MGHTLLVGLVLLTAGSALTAQGVKTGEPKRPALEAGRDSNSAAAYYYSGLSFLPKRPDDAANAFYWAMRLDPGWAEPRYARRIAILLKLPQRNLGDYLMGADYALKLPEARTADSLEYQAVIRNPFLYHKLDVMLVDEWLRTETTGELSIFDLDREPRFSGWLAYDAGRFSDAVKYYSDALRRTPKAQFVRLDRARAYFLMLQYDSARADISALLDGIKDLEESQMHVFESKAIFEYSLGKLDETMGRADAAKESYSRALLTDLSFFPAHAALGALSHAAGDTAGAVREYDLAVQLREDDPALRYAYGEALFDARRFEEAKVQFRRAIELEPYYVAPYFPLAYIADNEGQDPDAVALYTTFANRAPRGEGAKIAYARRRIGELGGAAADSARSH